MTDISFHSSYWKPRITDGQTTIHSFLILETTYERRTDISFHSSYSKPRMTDGQTFHFIPHIGNHVWQTDRHFITFLILETTMTETDRHFISFLILETTYDRRTDISFHSSYWKTPLTDGQTFHSSYWKTPMTDGHTFCYSSCWNPRMTDRHTFHFIPHIGNQVWLRRTDISFHSSYWKPPMTDRQTFPFIPHIGTHV